MISPAGLSLPRRAKKIVSWVDPNEGLENGSAEDKKVRK